MRHKSSRRGCGLCLEPARILTLASMAFWLLATAGCSHAPKEVDDAALRASFASDDAGQPADLDALSADLARARAEAVKNALVAVGISQPRILVDGKGADEPVADNAKPRGRLANRRVEIKLYVPPR